MGMPSRQQGGTSQRTGEVLRYMAGAFLTGPPRHPPAGQSKEGARGFGVKTHSRHTRG